ncbi:transcriptional regulator, DeoR family [Fulvimarina manganoxydans]|uniref:Transcriptional regulator, DeoR family n=1 Tax=Fulvimarina manganoxydans TaxID=937218 RepID=A0A1W2DKV2_9HYPH|nr:DeoR/GlpR family DNA-binding transcription regulator [Fulvimarina manganoxydans]SMC97656.1 transcriptional regulator, DeoR family [Fulvimarina manganoxydans]
MHERDRHRIIVSVVQARSVATVQELARLTEASEATTRRDIAALALRKKVKRVRGGAEALETAPFGEISSLPFETARTIKEREKSAIAKEAARLCGEGEAIIINGGTTTFQMVHHFAGIRLQVLTNSFSIANHLIEHSECTVMLPAGAIYRDQGLILSPFESDGIAHFRARRMFMGAQGISPYGIAETDPLIIQSEQRLMRQADELVLLVDSSKFHHPSSMIIAPLERAHIVITDDGVSDKDAGMVEAAGVRLLVANLSEEGGVQDVA